ncbi:MULTISPECIES: DUF3152 domain-containing protein [unclassified Streptomyces]|uniref:DUF3152 domain-containing protein n=1 Tax=unclassified Streptomyces TaxID=2593676 RepID=UPI0037F4ADBF
MGKRSAAHGRRAGHRVSARRSPLPKLVLPGLALIAAVGGGWAALDPWWDGERAGQSVAAAGTVGGVGVPVDTTTPGAPAVSVPPQPPEAPAAVPPPLPSPPPPPTPSPTPPQPPQEPREPAREPAPPSPSPSAEVPASGPGTFTTGRAQGEQVGSGTPRRYRVQVEDGINVSADQAAEEIQGILAHPLSWAANGRGAFQLVAEGGDFVFRIATPATADKLCLAEGLNTRGQFNCETTQGVVINLRRWMEGSPTFDGPATEYRHLIINHEVGHEIGIRRHMGCAGPGRLAPVMMQQIKGLDGCRSNAWPYDTDGTLIEGPVL